MKKIVMLFSFTLIGIITILWGGSIIKGRIISVSTVKVNPVTAENSVICTGKVERVQTRGVFSSENAVVKELYVSVGDSVQYGQPLMSITTIKAAEDNNSQETYKSLMENYYGKVDQEAFNQLAEAASAKSMGTQTETKEIYAPIAGEITAISTYSQAYIDPSKSVMEIASDPGLQIRLSVNESQISDIKTGQRAVISGVGFRDFEYTGRVKSISSEANQIVTTTGQETVVEVIVTVDNPTTEIKPGFTAKTKIITSESNNVLIVPYEAVRADEDGSEYVFKVENGRAVKAEITTKNEFESGFEVVSGLNSMDSIIINPDDVYIGTSVIEKTGGSK